MKRTRYQQGSIELRTTSTGKAWFYRWWEGKRHRGKRIGTLEQYPSEAKAKKGAEYLRLIANQKSPFAVVPSFAAVLDRYAAEEIPRNAETARSYLVWIRLYIKPEWGAWKVTDLADEPLEIREWLKRLDLAPKSKANIKAVMLKAFEAAMLWKYLPRGENPMHLVHIKGITKRQKQPRILSPVEFGAVLEKLTRQPHRMMFLLAGATGARRSELAGIKWGDVNWEHQQWLVQRSVVNGRGKEETKTKESCATIPLDTLVLNELRAFREASAFPAEDDYIFASKEARPTPGCKPYYPHKVIDTVNELIADLNLPRITWHPLRHSYRMWLDATGAPVGVQQRLMRHSDIRTTMNIYGDALDQDKRDANAAVIRQWKQ